MLKCLKIRARVYPPCARARAKDAKKTITSLFISLYAMLSFRYYCRGVTVLYKYWHILTRSCNIRILQVSVTDYLRVSTWSSCSYELHSKSHVRTFTCLRVWGYQKLFWYGVGWEVMDKVSPWLLMCPCILSGCVQLCEWVLVLQIVNWSYKTDHPLP